MAKFLFWLGLLLVIAPRLSAEEPVVMNLWPQDAPTWAGTTEQEHDTSAGGGDLVAGRTVIRLGHVSIPQLYLWPSAGETQQASQTTILICPGGGYSILAWDLEGTEIAERMSEMGYRVGVIKYRVPTRAEPQPWLAPVQDVQRAVSIVRELNVNAKRPDDLIGLVGFSAGGNAAARVAIAGTERFYEPIDATDQVSCQADFAGLVYPWLMVDADHPSGIIGEFALDGETPPVFFAHAIDDPVSCRNSLEFFSALQFRTRPAELHIFASGGHGFGARDANLPVANWPKLFDQWLRSAVIKPSTTNSE